jgi:hypothetical protein
MPSRQAARSRLAEAGNTAHELMGISGHKTMSMVQLYTAGADRKKARRFRHGQKDERPDRERRRYKPARSTAQTGS